jgi:hypothetical protein
MTRPRIVSHALPGAAPAVVPAHVPPAVRARRVENVRHIGLTGRTRDCWRLHNSLARELA